MKRLNAYYLISIISLAFMFLILMRTLQAIGWFEEENEGRSTQKVLMLAGSYSMTEAGSDLPVTAVEVTAKTDEDGNWLVIEIAGRSPYELRVNDFEDEQALVEIFSVDTAGNRNRLEACECPMSQDETGSWEGTTLGEFCSYDIESDSYLAIRFVGDKAGSTVIIESRGFEDKTLIQKQEFILRRRVPDE